MAILLSKNIAQCDDHALPRGATTARRDDRAAVGWAWTGRNLDEALAGGLKCINYCVCSHVNIINASNLSPYICVTIRTGQYELSIHCILL